MDKKKITAFLESYMKYLHDEKAMTESYLSEMSKECREVRIKTLDDAEAIFGSLSYENGFNLTKIK